MSSDSSSAPLPEPIRTGLVAIVVCTSLSLASTSSLLVYLLYKKIKDYRAFGRHGTHYDNPTQGSFWLINLFVADLVQGLGDILVGVTVNQNSLMTGPGCTLQGFLINSGDIASAIWSFVIAFHTFALLAGGSKIRGWVSEKTASGKLRWVVCGGLWAFVFLIGAIGPVIIQPLNPGNDDQVGPGWCWISGNYDLERLLLHYIFLFIDMFALTVLYCILFVYLVVQSRKFRTSESTGDNEFSTHELPNWQANLNTGNIPPPPTGLKKIMTTQTVTVITETSNAAVRRVRTTEAISRRRMTQVATRLLCYPIVYICLTMPVSIARLAQVSGHNWGLTAIQVGAAIYVCSGWVNVLLYTATRKGIISWDWLAPRKRKAIRLSGTPRLSAIRVVPKPPSNMEATSIEKSLNDVSEWDFAQRDQDITPEELE